MWQSQHVRAKSAHLALRKRHALRLITRILMSAIGSLAAGQLSGRATLGSQVTKWWEADKRPRDLDGHTIRNPASGLG